MREVSPELLSINTPEWIDLLDEYPSRFLFGTDACVYITYAAYPDIVAWFEEHIVPQLSREATETLTRGSHLQRGDPTNRASSAQAPLVSRPELCVFSYARLL